MKLYEIDARIAACVDEATGEIIDPEALDALEMARADKIEGAACWAKDSAALATALREEANTLMARARAAEARAEGLKVWLRAALNGQTFESARACVRYRRVQSVAILDEDKLPEAYLELKMTAAPKKREIAAAIKAGERVPGAALEEKVAVIVK